MKKIAPRWTLRAFRVPGALLGLAVFTCVFPATAAEEKAPPAEPVASAPTSQELALEECLKTAWDNNHRRPASRLAVVMAEAQHRQALAGYWPQVHLQAGYQRRDEAPNFIFPASVIPVPDIKVPAGTALIGVPAQLLNPLAPPGAMVQLPVTTPEQTIKLGQFDVPEQDVKLMDPDSFVASLNATWLLYDFGMRRGYREQAKGGLEVARAEARRTDLEIEDSVKRMYYGAVLARQLRQVGQDTLARMEATLNLTETMYKEGAGKVKKTDFLDNKVMVETLRSAVATLDLNEQMAQAALANTMGLPWNSSVRPKDREVPYQPFPAQVDQLVGTAYQFSPDWAKVEAAVQSYEGAVRTARSGHYPKLAVTGELHRWWNGYNSGMATERNVEGFTVGVGIELPLFDGFLTRNKVREARARLDQIKEQQLLLKDGIGLAVRHVILSLGAAEKQFQATQEAMKSAEENRDLNTRAYQNELVETADVIRAQLVEALMSAQHYKNRFDHVSLLSQLNLIVGTEVWKQLRASP